MSMIGEETFNTVAVYLTDPMWIAISIVTVVFFAILGGLLSARLMKKHFRRSGVVGVTS